MAKALAAGLVASMSSGLLGIPIPEDVIPTPASGAQSEGSEADSMPNSTVDAGMIGDGTAVEGKALVPLQQPGASRSEDSNRGTIREILARLQRVFSLCCAPQDSRSEDPRFRDTNSRRAPPGDPTDRRNAYGSRLLSQTPRDGSRSSSSASPNDSGITSSVSDIGTSGEPSGSLWSSESILTPDSESNGNSVFTSARSVDDLPSAYSPYDAVGTLSSTYGSPVQEFVWSSPSADMPKLEWRMFRRNSV